jgi:hypothetical protein
VVQEHPNWEKKSHSCALDVAEAYPAGLPCRHIARYWGVSKERPWQIEQEALAKAGPFLKDLLRDSEE